VTCTVTDSYFEDDLLRKTGNEGKDGGQGGVENGTELATFNEQVYGD